MKPSFTLNFTDDSIQLLHRTGKGWVCVGETPFAAPDLDDALDYMRKTALGLEPAGFTTQLVIPNSQIRYLELEAPGPDAVTKRAEILQALEGKTPYAAEDLVFDWSGKGRAVRVAVLARETLQEAEGFATTHKFNPVGFTAIPESGSFSGGPWFGETSQAESLLAPGQKVERDRGAIVILARDLPAPVAPPKPQMDLALNASTAPAAKPVTEAVAAADIAPESATEPAPVPATEPAPEPAKDITAAPEVAPAADVPDHETDLIAALATDQLSPSATPDSAPLAAPPDQPPPVAVESAKAAQADEAMIPAPLGVAVAAPVSAEKPGSDDEAPFTHVADNPAFPEDEDGPDRVPDDDQVPADRVRSDRILADRAAGSPPARPAAALAAALNEPGLDDDVPPAPPSAAMVAFASRRGADAAGRAPSLGAAERPDPAALARAARGKPVEDLPPMPRPPQAPARPAGDATGGLRGNVTRGLGSLVAAPGLGGTRKAKVKPGPLPPPPVKSQPQAAATGFAAGDAAKSLTRPGGTFGNRPAPRPKSRAVLFLSLVAVLLLALALVAAWSSYYLAGRATDPSAPVVATVDAGSDIPAVEDEMLADGEAGQMGGDLTVAYSTDAGLADALPAADPAPETLPEAAPETALAADSPVTQPQPETQDEIFLATSESPPPALDALSLPPPETTSDALPVPQMPPPPFGTVYAFDANGLLKPTPEGIVSPEGVLLIAGKPPVLPPSRSDAATQAADAAATAAVAATEAMPAVPPADATEHGMVESVGVGETAPADATVDATAQASGQPAEQPNPDLADRRPKPRPDGLVPNPDDAALAVEPATSVTSLRPRSRPGIILAAGERARQETEASSLAAATPAAVAEDPAETEAQLAAAAAAEAANPSVVAISRRPAERPKNFNRAVEAAVAAAIRAPTPKPEPEPEAQPEPVPKKTAKKAPAPDVKPDEQSEMDEPEVATTAAPKVPTKASVAKQATYVNAINLSKTNLIGVYGTPSKRYALIRQANGKYKKVTVGDKVDGGKVQAITENEVRYQKGGRLISLKMPKS